MSFFSRDIAQSVVDSLDKLSREILSPPDASRQLYIECIKLDLLRTIGGRNIKAEESFVKQIKMMKMSLRNNVFQVPSV